MTKEEITKIIDSFNQRPPIGGVSLELIDFENNNLKLKFNFSDKTEFKVQGKLVTMEEESKKFVIKYLKEKISAQGGSASGGKNLNIILI